jgi:hypothetical protein
VAVAFDSLVAAGVDDQEFFNDTIKPILIEYCFDCHAEGADEGGVELDQMLKSDASHESKSSWHRVLKQIRAGLMPPSDASKLDAEQKRALENWIVKSKLELDSVNPFPGRVTVRRLNRVEYRNTVKALTGVDFDTTDKFPADDTGHGFDNIGDVLTVSPLLLEKYFDAANEIVSKAIPLEDSIEKGADAADRSHSEKYKRFFPEPIPSDSDARRKYARQVLEKFASHAYRRPIDAATADRLVSLAETGYSDGKRFEAGVAEALTAVLASPRFVFREEFDSEGSESDHQRYPLLDEYSLASRLSYFLWSSMPDDELVRLAKAKKLRDNLNQQIDRMVADPKFNQFVSNFGGQWLQSRAILATHVNPRAVLGREFELTDELRKQRVEYLILREKDQQRNDKENERFEWLKRHLNRKFRKRGPNVLDWRLRESMKRETDMYLEHVIRGNRSLLDLLDSDYTFLDERLAKHYEIKGVKGSQTRKVTLPGSSVRGGVLTQGTILVTTSNPDRTSPVKRGVFVLENLLGTPTASPPPNTPSLEASSTEGGVELSLRQSLQQHRDHPNCISCHKRMDPPGLALENFNAIGKFRTQELGEKIDVTGELATGETFKSIIELKRILREHRSTDFYRCLTEKLMTYALGREITYHDIPTIDSIVKQLKNDNGRSLHLIRGIIKSSAFQRRSYEKSEAKQFSTDLSIKN